MLILEATKSYEVDKRIEGFSPQTLNAYKLQARLLMDYFGNIKTMDIIIQDLKEYLADTGQNLKSSGLSHRIRFIRSLFRYLHEEGIIETNPAIKIREPKVGKSIPKFLTEREIEHLRDACFTPMEKALFEFMFSTGCRIGEIVTLDRKCINWESQSAIVRGKGDKEREVSILLYPL